MVGKIAILTLRLILAAVFLYAGVNKIWDFRHGQSATPDFTIAIQHFQLLPSPDWSVLLAIYLPWLEVVAAGALFLRRWALGAALALTAMTTVFLVALGSAWARGLDITCGCFGREETVTPYPTLIVRDALLLGAALVLVWRESRRQRADG